MKVPLLNMNLIKLICSANDKLKPTILLHLEMKNASWYLMKLIKILLNVARFCLRREPQHQSVPYHYYEPRGPDECAMYISHERGKRGSHHRFITEKRAFANWARTFDIHFFQPDWSPPPLPDNRTLPGTAAAAIVLQNT